MSNTLLVAPFMSPPRLSTASAATTMTSDSGTISRRVPRNKDFLIKHGHRHHSFDPEKAPYPLSYDRQILEL